MFDDLENNGCTNHKDQMRWNLVVNCILITSTNTSNCDIVQRFALNHSVGGTESGLVASITDIMDVDYLKK